MYKFWFLFLCVHLPLQSLFCQNYECIQTDGIYFYDYEDSSPQEFDLKIFSYRIDSIRSLGINQVYYTQKESINSDPANMEGCYLPGKSSWIGDVTKTPSGIYYFTNDLYIFDWVFMLYRHIQDTMMIKSQAQLNDSWLFYKTDTLGSCVEAKVIAIDTMNILGIIDSVKFIELDIFDDNTITLLLSKNHGLIRCLNFNEFYPGVYYYEPNWSYATYLLSGFPGVNHGRSLLSRGKIYDFDLSDEFHSSSRYDDEYGNLLALSYSVKIILDKWFSEDENQVFYTIDYTYWTVSEYGSTLSHDTVVNSYNQLNQIIPDSVNLPYENIYYNDDSTEIGYYGMYYGYGGREFVENRTEYYYKSLDDSCYYDMLWIKNYTLSPWPNQTKYIEGCGSFDTYIDPEWWSCDVCEYLEYYKKGEQIWGNPLVIPVGIKEEQKSRNQVSVYPSPTKEVLNIELRINDVQFPATIYIINNSGQVSYQGEMNCHKVTLPVHFLSDGLYLIKIKSSDNQQFTNKFVIKN